MKPSSLPQTDGPGGGGHLSADLCIDLLHDQLPPDLREEVLAHLRTCPACERRFQEIVAARERTRASTALAVPRHGWFALPRPIPIAAALAVAAVAAWLLWIHPVQRASNHLPLPHWLPTDIASTLARSQSGAADEDVMAGLSAYAAQDLDGAIEHLQHAAADGPWEIVRQVYLGNALAWQGRYEEAAAVLEPLRLEVLPDPWASEAQWTLLLAFRGTGRHQAADSLLDVLATEPGDIGERARRYRAAP